MKWIEFKRIIDLASDTYRANSSVSIFNTYQRAVTALYRAKTAHSRSKTELEMYQSAVNHAELHGKDIRAFQEKMAQEINLAFGKSFSLDAPLQETTTALSEDDLEEDLFPNPAAKDKNIEADIVIVGGGPIGYAQAMGFKKLNPRLNIVVLEKYPEFQRKHTLVMQAKYLKSLMRATDSMADPELLALLEQLERNRHIRTNALQEKFKSIAEKAGVITRIETVESETIHEQLLRFKPKLIIGADGTHSVVNQNLFPAHNQKKHEVDFAMQVRYEIDGDADRHWEDTIAFYQTLARQGLIATEQVGRLDPETGKTPVTVQLIIPKEDYEKLKAHATAKTPIRPFLRSDEHSHLVPKHLKHYINDYFVDKIAKGLSDPIDSESIRISVNELPASQALQTVIKYEGIDVALNGDAALGLSYFKGLNAGLEALTMFFTNLKPAIQQGLTNKHLLQESLTTYQDWFSPYADKKVEEVKQYSAFKVRPSMKLVKIVRGIKGFSHRNIPADARPVVDTYYRILFHAGKNERVIFNPYPHRSYDPNIQLGQFAYIPISYTLKKIGKLFIDYFKPYKEGYQLAEDFKQPLSGITNASSGLLKIIVSVFSLNPYRFGDGIFCLLRGLIEIATTPLAWFVKPLTRGSISFFLGEPKIEESKGIKKLVDLGEQLLSEQNDDDFSLAKMQNLLGVCNDLHRKFDKGRQREQVSDINTQAEQKCIDELADINNPLTRRKFRDYLSIFGGRASNPSDSDNEEDLESSIVSSPK